MKRLLPLMALFACATPGAAGAGAENLAKPVEQGVTELDADGLHILVKRIPHVQLVAAQLYVEGGVRNWSADDEGIERLALASAIEGGAEDLPGSAFHRALARLGTQIGAESNEDYSVVEVKSLLPRWQASFDLLADAFLHPALPASEVEVQRQLQLSALRQEQEDPDAQLAVLSHALFYRGLPYANRALGTPATVAKLTRDQLAAHLASLRQKSQWLLVVVGDVDPGEIAAWARKTFAAVPKGSWQPQPLEPPHFDAPKLEVVNRPLPTTYVMATFPAPSWRDPDLAVAAVAMNVLKETLFEEVRTKRELSYAPAAGLSLGGAGEGFLYVTAEDPNLTYRVMLDVLHGLEAGRFQPAVLEGDKRVFLTNFLMRDEATDGQAALLGQAQLLGGDWRLAGTLLDRVRGVTAAQVSRFLKGHARDMQTVVLGDAAKIDQKLFGST
ncbi:MAG TPA: pitrilysin family protein [Myxococcales bacterium]|nr:pitrilysin family protein [Myxococcales bacterium]